MAAREYSRLMEPPALDIGAAGSAAYRRGQMSMIGLFSGLYFASVIGQALSKPFWYDEIITLYNARLPGLSALLQALAQHSDYAPPAVHLLTRAAAYLPGNELVSARLPAMIGVWIMCLCLYVLVARRLAWPYAASAMLIPMLTPIYDYAFEARSYGIALGLAGLSLVCWQAASENNHRRLALPGLAACSALILLTHYYYLTVTVVIGLAELVRAFQRRRLDWPVLAALACSVLGLPIVLHLIKGNLDGGVTAKIQADLLSLIIVTGAGLFSGLVGPLSLVGSGILVAYALPVGAVARRWIAPDQAPALAAMILSLGVIALTNTPRWTLASAAAIGLSLLWLRRPSSPSPGTSSIPIPEMVLYAALPALAVLPMIATGIEGLFSIRYCLFAVLGAAGLAVIFFARLEERWPAVGRALFAVLSLFVMIRFVPGWQHLVSPALPEVNPILTADTSGLPIVVTQSNDFMDLQYRAPEPLRSRLVYLADPAKALNYGPSNMVEVGLLNESRFAPLAVFAYTDYIKSHAHFLVYTSNPRGWSQLQLLADGVRLNLLANSGSSRLYEASVDGTSR
jgi:hypothetical protein